MNEKMKIRQVVDLLEKRGSPVNASALRFWETEGYLESERSKGRHRMYPPLEVERAYLLSLVSRMRRKLPHSPLSFRSQWEELCKNILDSLKSGDISPGEVKSYQDLVIAMLDRMELESPTIQPLAAEKTQLPEDEILTVNAAIIPSEHYYYSGVEATLVRSIEWERQRNPEVASYLPSLSRQAWAEAKLQLEYLTPTGILDQLRDRYLSLLKVELQPALDQLDLPGRTKLMAHELFEKPSGLVALKEIRGTFSLLKAGELVKMLLETPQTMDGLMIQLARRLEEIATMKWGEHYREWSSRSPMPSSQGYIAYLRNQYEFLDDRLSDEAKVEVRLHHIMSYINGIEQKLKDTRGQGVSVSVTE